jgi:hypothetical protein
MHKRAIAAVTGALSALLLFAVPASADPGQVGGQASIDWRLVVVLTVLALSGFYYVLAIMGQKR